jgi:zinc protease
MAVIAVGDFDPTWMRGEIERRFGDLAAPPSARPRTRAQVPEAGGTRVSIESDRELPSASVALFDLVPHRPESTPRHLRRGVLEQLWVAILDERFDILRRRPDAPFSGASVGIDSLTREIDTLVRVAAVKGDRIEDALRSLVTEVLRVERHGVTAGELERARQNLGRVYEQYAATEGTTDSGQYAAEATRNFLEGELMIGPQAETAAALRFLPGITLEELNTLAKGFGVGDNRTIEIAAREGQPLPTKERVLAILTEVEASDIPPWEEAAAAPALMPVAPVAGRIVAERTIDSVGVTEWTLSNGARVVVKPTDFSADRFELYAESPGGLAAVSDADFPSARFAEEALAVGGLGELDATALGRALAGKSASAATTLGDTREGLAGGGSPKDLETTLQLVWLRFMAPRRDDQAIAVWRHNVAEGLTNARRAPAARFAIELDDFFHQDHPRKRAPTAADLEAFDAERALAVHRARFGDASDFTFVIVGAVDLAALRPLVETYLASLPGAGRSEREAEVGARLPRGKLARTWHLGQEPRATVRLAYFGEETWTRDKERDMYLLGEVLGLRLEAVLREELSGVYDVSARGVVARGPRQERILWIGFGCAPDNVPKLVGATRGVIADLVAKGPSEGELEKVRRSFVRTREVQLRQNGFWTGWLAAAWRYGEDPALILDPSGLVARATVPNVRAAAKRYLDTRRSLEAVLLPAEP